MQRGYDLLKNYKGLNVCMKDMNEDDSLNKTSLSKISNKTFEWMQNKNINCVNTYSQNVTNFLQNKDFNIIPVNSLESMKKTRTGVVDDLYNSLVLFEPSDWEEYLAKRFVPKLEEILELKVKVTKGLSANFLVGTFIPEIYSNIPKYFDFDTENKKMIAESERFNKIFYTVENKYKKSILESKKRVLKNKH